MSSDQVTPSNQGGHRARATYTRAVPDHDEAAEPSNAASTRNRLLRAALQLFDESEDGNVSTREICQLAGVQAPTLYHHFGSKQGLLAAVVQQGLSPPGANPSAATEDPVSGLRTAWDHHVQYGLAHRRLYALMCAQVTPGRPSAITSAAETSMLRTLRVSAVHAPLAVPPDLAAARLVAANVGVTLTLLAQPTDAVDLALSVAVRDAMLASILAPTRHTSGAPVHDHPLPAAAAALGAALGGGVAPLSPAESALLREWLDRLTRS